MATEELRLEASVVDRFSTPLNRLRTALGAVKPPQALLSSTKDFEKFHAAVSRSTQAIQGGYTQAVSGLGVQSVFAAGAIAGLTATISKFVSSTGELKALSRETGITIQTFRNLKAVAEQFQSSPEAIEGGLKRFGSNLYDFRRGIGETYAGILKYNQDFATKLRSAKSPDEALDIALGTLSKDKDRQRAARISELLFGTPDFERLTGQGREKLRTALADAQKRLGILTPEDEKRAEAFETAIGKLKQTFSGLATTIGTELAPPMTKAIEAIDKMIQNSKGEFGKEMIDGVRTLGETLKSFNWSAMGEAFGVLGSSLRDIVSLLQIMGRLSSGDTAGAWKEFKDMGARSAAPGAIKAARDEVEARKKTLAEFDKTNPNDARRRWHEENLRTSEDKLKKAIEEGARLGIKDGLDQALQRSSYGGGFGGAQIWNASLGGGGGMGPGRRAAAAVGGSVRDAIEGAPDTPGSRRVGRGGPEAPGVPGPAGGMTMTPNEPTGRRFGGSRSWRNNNPGNIEYGPFARSQGATGTDGRFAIFPNYEAGRKAQEKLLFDSKGYRNLTLAQAIARWAPASENNVPAYLKAMSADPGARMSSFSPEQRVKLLDAMQRHEGWRVGRIIGGRAESGLPQGGYWGRDSKGNPVAVGPDGQALPGKRGGGAFNSAREAGNFGANQQSGPTGRAELEVTINGLPHGWKSRADGGELFRDVKVGRGRSMMQAPDEP